MKQTYLILTLSVLFSTATFAQNYEQVDKKVSGYSKSFSNLDKLADQIN
ncbi:MAG: hypothetical protein HC831_18340 [Chloroflexia bacterium]|nr:hypothetical protein [Chloroflexia bacterium]